MLKSTFPVNTNKSTAILYLICSCYIRTNTTCTLTYYLYQS
nr:MAG TPA: hypothetical protein [Caudoviricetes sp.]